MFLFYSASQSGNISTRVNSRLIFGKTKVFGFITVWVSTDIQILVWGWKVNGAAGSRTPGSGEEPVQSGTLEELLHKTTEYKPSVVFSHFTGSYQ